MKKWEFKQKWCKDVFGVNVIWRIARISCGCLWRVSYIGKWLGLWSIKYQLRCFRRKDKIIFIFEKNYQHSYSLEVLIERGLVIGLQGESCSDLLDETLEGTEMMWKFEHTPKWKSVKHEVVSKDSGSIQCPESHPRKPTPQLCSSPDVLCLPPPHMFTPSVHLPMSSAFHPHTCSLHHQVQLLQPCSPLAILAAMVWASGYHHLVQGLPH